MRFSPIDFLEARKEIYVKRNVSTNLQFGENLQNLQKYLFVFFVEFTYGIPAKKACQLLPA